MTEKFIEDMLQKTENVAKNVANENSQDLTEQWKKSELPEGHYYVKDGENLIAEYLDGYFYNNGEPMTSFSGGVDEVLDKVPSYEEFLSLTYAKEEDEKIIAEYEQENAQLKDILKEIRGKIHYINIPKNRHNIFDKYFLDKIDEVLK